MNVKLNIKNLTDNELKTQMETLEREAKRREGFPVIKDWVYEHTSNEEDQCCEAAEIVVRMEPMLSEIIRQRANGILNTQEQLERVHLEVFSKVMEELYGDHLWKWWDKQ